MRISDRLLAGAAHALPQRDLHGGALCVRAAAAGPDDQGHDPAYHLRQSPGVRFHDNHLGPGPGLRYHDDQGAGPGSGQVRRRALRPYPGPCPASPITLAWVGLVSGQGPA